jgi:glycosyltransferase involved in cell wall biosynthesis
MLKPVVSVVVTVFNLREWIGDALASVLKQTCGARSMELIVVDDGSTDDSASIIEPILQAAPIKQALFQVHNGGPSRARNIGCQRATGEWVQILDGDDLLHERKIEIQLAASRRLGPETAVIYSDWCRLRWQGQEWVADSGAGAPRIGIDPLADLLRTENFIPTGSQLFRRSWLERVGGFDERYRLIEDGDLLMRVAMGGGGFHRVASPEPLFFYRQREGSLSRSVSREFIEGCIRNASMAEAYWRGKNSLTADRADLVASIYFQAARYFASRDKNRFDAIVDQIGNLSPRVIPQGPRHLKYASRIVGYRRAERLAVLYRRIKALAAV